MQTPMRDELGLNDPDSLGFGDSKREQRAREIMMKNELRAGLSQLPAPKNAYEIEIPELPEEEGAGENGVVEDAADVLARKKAEQQRRLEIEMKKRSQVGAV